MSKLNIAIPNICLHNKLIQNGQFLIKNVRIKAMRSKNEDVMRVICAYVDSFYREHHVSPSVNEIAKGVGIAKTTSSRYLVDMDARGMLSYNSGITMTPQMTKCKSDYFSAPLVGTIRCGSPETEEEYVEEYVSLPKSIFGPGEFYLLRASGDSMVDAGIENGDHCRGKSRDGYKKLKNRINTGKRKRCNPC